MRVLARRTTAVTTLGLAGACLRPLPAHAATRSDAIKLTPGWEGAPWVAKIQQLLNVSAQGALVCCLLAFVLGGGALALGRVLGSNRAGNLGLQFLLGGAAGAVVIISAPSLLSWLIK